MSDRASRFARFFLAWIFVVTRLSFAEKKAALREIAGLASVPVSRERFRFMIARGFALALAERPAVFIAFPFAFVVIVAAGLAHWARLALAFF